MDLPKKMSLKKYTMWINQPKAKRSNIPLLCTLTNIKQNSFGARNYAQFKKNPTPKRAIALRNWGFDVDIPRRRGRQ